MAACATAGRAAWHLGGGRSGSAPPPWGSLRKPGRVEREGSSHVGGPGKNSQEAGQWSSKRKCVLGSLEHSVEFASGAQPPKTKSDWYSHAPGSRSSNPVGPLRTVLSLVAPVSETHTPPVCCPGSSLPELALQHGELGHMVPVSSLRLTLARRVSVDGAQSALADESIKTNAGEG